MERLDILTRAISEAQERVSESAALSEARFDELRKAHADEDAMVAALAKEFIEKAYASLDDE